MNQLVSIIVLAGISLAAMALIMATNRRVNQQRKDLDDDVKDRPDSQLDRDLDKWMRDYRRLELRRMAGDSPKPQRCVDARHQGTDRGS